MHAGIRLGYALLLGVAWAAGPAGAVEPEASASDCFLTAFKAGDAEAVAACYAEDAVMWFPGGPMVKGREAIRDGFAGYLATVEIKDVRLDGMGQESMGDTRVAWGTYEIHFVDKATQVESVDRGRFVDVQKKIDGRWLYTVDHPSSEPAAPGE
ncbi:nuclear transport factor 2 family protein [Luteimonas vadosa]|uniref:SnoaL-like domain-containing protein n=1 Tax=Luteimonas vadosa TaxID=1165507 RepID=A0ABP9E4B2_9GAMM